MGIPSWLVGLAGLRYNPHLGCERSRIQILDKPTSFWIFQVAQWQRICLPMQKTEVQSLGGEDLLEEEMATHSRILAWRIPWTREPEGLQSMGSHRVKHD